MHTEVGKNSGKDTLVINKMNIVPANSEETVSYNLQHEIDLDAEVSIAEINREKRNNKNRVPWYYAPGFLLFWFALFVAVILPVYNYLPESLTLAHEKSKNKEEFIAEYAEHILFKFDGIGEKVIGSWAAENLTAQLVLDNIEAVRSTMRDDLFDLELDVQIVSGSYIHWTMANMYQGIQNIVVKLSTKASGSESYLLVNSHFDSKPSSPGTGDDGAMVVVMLEVLRQMATSERVFEHPIVFLFNGGEEVPLQASHGFITQHKWAKNCKALINLDAAGSGGREILFQGGPNHPWLMRYYKNYAAHPFATTMGEEIFQANLLPSDTDFRIFRDFGSVPGLDLAQCYNGYVYHTKYDTIDVISSRSLQSSGENVLSLVRGLSNAPELRDTEAYAEGHAVFFDYLGLFFVYYTETTAIIVNTCSAIIGILVVSISLWRMARVSFVPLAPTMCSFLLVLALHLLGFVLAFGLPLLMAVMFDSGNRSMTWFSNIWLCIGLYITPTLFGLCAPTLLYFSFTKNNNILLQYRFQMAMHAHCVILSILSVIFTVIGIRSSYLITITLLFYVGTLIINLLSTLHDRRNYWIILHTIGQILPFLYYTYLLYSLLNILIPMTGRNGTTVNPDLYIAFLCALFSVLAMGFLIQLINIFHFSRLILFSLVVITFVFSMIAVSSVGFPYRAKTNPCRINFLHVNRIFYEYDGSVSLSDSGYYFDFQDRLMHHPFEDGSIDLSGVESIEQDCDKYMFCGVPVFNHRWMKARRQGRWLPRSEAVRTPGTARLELLKKTVNTAAASVRYEFQMYGITHMSLFIQPEDDVTISEWSFVAQMLQDEKYGPPYHIFYTNMNDKTPLKFHIDFTRASGAFDVPVFQLGFSAHYVSQEHERDVVGQQFIKDFPDYVHCMEWPSSYERYVF